MKIKVCGMKDPQNIKAIRKLPIDYMGFIFYSKSPRCVHKLAPEIVDILPDSIRKTGVFVNEKADFLQRKIEEYRLNAVQLHGNEPVKYVEHLQRENPGLIIVKAFRIAGESDFLATEEYGKISDYFLFDTKTPQYGGSGKKFDWSVLDSYQGKTPFFLSGGISAEDAEEIKKIQHPGLYGLDLNSRFEIEPGLKDIKQIEQFLKTLRDEQNYTAF
jgi:phosphoribosylanthranilate isomerase